MAAFTHVHRLIPLKMLRLNTCVGRPKYLSNEKRSYRSLQFNLRFVYEVVVNADFIGHRHADKRVDFQRKTPKNCRSLCNYFAAFPAINTLNKNTPHDHNLFYRNISHYAAYVKWKII